MGDIVRSLEAVKTAISDLQLLFGQGPWEGWDVGRERGRAQIGDAMGWWQNRGSMYFNCSFVNEPPDMNYMTYQDALDLEDWFTQAFPKDRPNVLKSRDNYGGKWNFTLVYNNTAFNFHMHVL